MNWRRSRKRRSVRSDYSKSNCMDSMKLNWWPTIWFCLVLSKKLYHAQSWWERSNKNNIYFHSNYSKLFFFFVFTVDLQDAQAHTKKCTNLLFHFSPNFHGYFFYETENISDQLCWICTVKLPWLNFFNCDNTILTRYFLIVLCVHFTIFALFYCLFACQKIAHLLS